MDAWKQKKSLMKGTKYVTTLSPMEREVLGTLTSTVSEALIKRCQSAPKDELAELTGMPSGHKDAPEDPSLARLLPDFERAGDEEYEGDNQLLRSLHENDICRGKLTNLQVINQALGPTGSVNVAVAPDELDAWVQGLNDLRLYLAAGEVTGGPDAEQQRSELVAWLAYCQGTLVDAAMGQLPDDVHDAGRPDT
ncbi:DUF2017 domain-containing protein [Corynebacterium mendelii]|uniref:DUF2017 domain-containing protein n=1 Tax=Corynebacterium mendelii TaxID=2765362 RepID=A0A939E1T4_9CORY|nr:DUF2017 domain-containing protein [Corynebacterium mendelii]MBN9644131.1 DUF2017 domain-containing protein [Corynebacterium mendelii]